MNSPNKPVRKAMGCLFPFCACIEGTLGCAHEPYDLRQPHNQVNNLCELTHEWFHPDPFDQVMGG